MRSTQLINENGSGKSTLLEAIAIACGFNPEGGTRNLQILIGFLPDFCYNGIVNVSV